MPNLSARRFSAADVERFELNISSAQAAKAKYHLTILDFLVGLRYKMGKDKWEETLAHAVELCRAYDSYHDVQPERIDETYGED